MYYLAKCGKLCFFLVSMQHVVYICCGDDLNMQTLEERITELSVIFGSQTKLRKHLGYNSDADLSKIKNGSAGFGSGTKNRFIDHGFNPYWFINGSGYPWADNEKGEAVKELINKRTNIFTKQSYNNPELESKKKLIQERLRPVEYTEVTSLNSGAAAGGGTPFLDGQDVIDVPKLLVEDVKRQFLIDCCGDSMLPLIEPEDRLLCNKVQAPNPSDIIVCMLNGELLVKYYFPTYRTLYLKSENPDYQDIAINENDELVIFGEVNTILRNIKKNRLK